MEDASRTSVLSFRWRNIFSLSPIHLDTRYLNILCLNPQNLLFKDSILKKKKKKKLDEVRWTIDAIETILSHHQGPICSLHLSKDICDRLLQSRRNWDLLRAPYENWGRFDRTLNRWVETLARKGIQTASFSYKVPSRIFDCQSLCGLELDCAIDEEQLQVPPNLTELRLTGSSVSQRNCLRFCLVVGNLLA